MSRAQPGPSLTGMRPESAASSEIVARTKVEPPRTGSQKDGSGDATWTSIDAPLRLAERGTSPRIRARIHPAWSLVIPTALMAFVAFLPILNNEFVDRDDPENFLENPYFRGLGPDQIRWAFVTFHHGVYQPLSWLIFEAQYAGWGLDPWGYHLISLLLHTVSTAALYVLTVTLLRLCQPSSSGGVPGASTWAPDWWSRRSPCIPCGRRWWPGSPASLT